MKKSELKKVLKPLIKECIKEVLLEETGVLAKVVSEVASGMGQQVIIAESSQPKREKFLQPKKVPPSDSKRAKKQLLDSIGKDAFNGINIFEGVDPITDKAPPPGEKTPSNTNPLRDMNPNDPGVDISKFFG
jgi:hypothetical protein